MLISYNKNFIFLANYKCASTAIERKLRKFSELAITGTTVGKHLSYAQIEKNMNFAFKRRSIEDFFRFGVVREPVDRSLSWFNYRNKEKLTKEIALEKFRATIVPNMAGLDKRNRFGQHGFFSDSEGQLGMDYLIAYPNLNPDLEKIFDLLQLERERTKKNRLGKQPVVGPSDSKPLNVERKVSPKTLPLRNVSSKVLTKEDLPPDLHALINDVFRKDLELYEQALNGHFGKLEDAVSAKRPVDRNPRS